MILSCKGTCARVATSFKRQGEVPSSCTPIPATLLGSRISKIHCWSTANLEILNAFICNSVFICSNLNSYVHYFRSFRTP